MCSICCVNNGVVSMLVYGVILTIHIHLIVERIGRG